MQSSETIKTLYRIKRGLASYVSYLAACEMNESFSEYILYEPTLRILTACLYVAKCEVPCPGFKKVGRGDVKKIDFVAASSSDTFALEMKWVRAKRVNVAPNLLKLQNYTQANRGHRAFLLLFGRRSNLEDIKLDLSFLKEQGKAVYADLGITQFGCRNYELKDA